MEKWFESHEQNRSSTERTNRMVREVALCFGAASISTNRFFVVVIRGKLWHLRTKNDREPESIRRKLENR